MPAITYSATHWRQVSVGSTEPSRFLMRQVRHDGEAVHAEIYDGGWRELRTAESLLPVPRRSDMPQIDNDWVR
jgi:hypothetical protein